MNATDRRGGLSAQPPTVPPGVINCTNDRGRDGANGG